MRLRFFTIPVFDSHTAQAELDRFLASHRVLTVDRQLIDDGTRSAWAICLAHVEGGATAHADARNWRGEQLRRCPPLDA